MIAVTNESIRIGVQLSGGFPKPRVPPREREPRETLKNLTLGNPKANWEPAPGLAQEGGV